ncbi:hypothetical protein D3C81_2022600 [compost metagenome]
MDDFRPVQMGSAQMISRESLQDALALVHLRHPERAGAYRAQPKGLFIRALQLLRQDGGPAGAQKRQEQLIRLRQLHHNRQRTQDIDGA